MYTDTIHNLFERQAALTPHHTALSFKGSTLTFQDLNTQANQVAHYLRSLCSKRSLVGLSMDTSPQALICILGIFKAECIYVPIHPARLDVIAKQIQPAFIFTDILCERIWSTIASMPGANLCKTISPEETAYLMYTSGSSGTPKGVMGHHQGLLNRFQWMWERWPFQLNEQACQKTSFYFVDSFWEIFGPLLKGVPLIIIPHETVINVDLMIATLNRQAVTRIVLVPSLLKAILESPKIHELQQLHLWTVSGEALSADLVLRFKEKLPHAKLLNIYGSSEVAADVTCYEAHRWNGETKTIPIGKPISNTAIHLFNERLEAVPQGETGEICVEGVGVALGYYQEPELTAESFIRVNQKWLYRTGDFGRYLSDGNLEYLGRRDRQIKIHGQRIDCNEIEQIICTHSNVSDCAVILCQKHLQAFVVLRTKLEKDELSHFLTPKLPSYMHPREFVFLENIPLNANGKVDYHALKTHQTGTHSSFDLPKSPLEQTISQTWCEILDIAEIRGEEHFFLLGGDSLAASQMIARLDSLLNIDIPIHLIFEHPNLRDFAEKIAHLPIKKMSSIGGRPYAQCLPASYGQLRSLKIEGDIIRQNLVCTAFEFIGDLRLDKLQAAFSRMVKRHEILRTSFRRQGNEWYQHITDHVNVEIQIHNGECDLTSVSSISMPLEIAPLFRLHLYRTSAIKSILVVIMHHLITDGLSQNLFKTELNDYYNGKTPACSGVNLLNYADFTLWQWESTWDNQLDFWKSYLHQMPLKAYLKADFSTSLKREYLVDSYLVTLSEVEFTSLKLLSKQLEASLFITLLAVFQILLSLHSGEEDIVVGSPVSNRHRAGSEDILGPLVNIVCLRNRCDKEMSVVDFIERVKRSTLSVYDNQEYPFHKLALELSQFANQEYLSLFQIMFGYGGDKASLTFEGLRCRELTVKTTHFHYDLTTVIHESDTDLKISMLYSKDKFKLSTVEKFANKYKELLCQVVNTPHQLIGHL